MFMMFVMAATILVIIMLRVEGVLVLLLGVGQGALQHSLGAVLVHLGHGLDERGEGEMRSGPAPLSPSLAREHFKPKPRK